MNSIFEENYLNEISMRSGEEAEPNFEHRASCHRCGNIRKNVVKCSVCPHVFCKKCADKMVSMDGNKAFVDGCPLCKDLCCCGSRRTPECTRQYHCYKKCLRSRMSPTSRNSSPRMLTSLRRYPSYQSYQSYQSQHSTIDEYMPKDSDSEDELPVQKAPMPLVGNGKLSSFPSMDALNTMSLQEGTPPGHAMFQVGSQSSRVPFSLAPIDTSVGLDLNKDIYERSKSKASRTVHAETPTKRMRTAEYPFPFGGPANGSYQREIDVQFRQACFATQPPFNSGIPSIFAPHSLTRETNPFFLQSSLPTSAVLPSIQTLLQSEHANPFLDSIPPCLKSELGNMHFPYELVQAQAQTQGGSLNSFAPDPGMGYGFTFGGNGFIAPPPPSRPSTRVARQASGEKASVAQLPAPQLSAEVAPVTPHAGVQAFVSTPNIDRACEILCNQQARNSRNGMDGTAVSGPGGGSKGTRRSAVVTSEKPPAPSTTRSQLSELFCTPVAQEATAFGQPSHSQRSAESGGTSYEWTGSSIGSLHNLGVEVLTPAALPQCTPMTVEPPQYPSYWQYLHNQANHQIPQIHSNQSYHHHMNQYPNQYHNQHDQRHHSSQLQGSHQAQNQTHPQNQTLHEQGQNSNQPHSQPPPPQSFSQQYPPYTQYSEFHTAAEPDRDSQYLLNSFLSDAADGLSELAQDDIFALCRDVDTIHSHITTPGPPHAMDYSNYHSSIPAQGHSSGSSVHAAGLHLSCYISTPSTEQESQKLRELTQLASTEQTDPGNHHNGQPSVPLSASAPLTQVERGEPYEAYLYSCDGTGKVSIQAQTETDNDMKVVAEDGAQ